MSKNIFKNQKGISLYLGIIFTALIFAIALMIANLFIIRIQLARDILSSVAAFYGADSVLECAQLEITKRTTANPEIPCSPPSSPNLQDAIIDACRNNMMQNSTTIGVSVACSGNSISSVSSHGSFGGVKRSTRVDF